ncbi:hypothetical protein DFS34DRAFT_644190 [Phlyctochytrium arcticum]|nr:hypothetical protein DFS34DRAFT_644190 [Phlyctochytrium arcticum]
MTRTPIPSIITSTTSALLSSFPLPPTHIPTHRKPQTSSPRSRKSSRHESHTISLLIEKELPPLPYLSPLVGFMGSTEGVADGRIEDIVLDIPYRVPTVLRDLRQRLVSLNGYHTETLFRVSSDPDRVRQVLDHPQDGIRDCQDVHVLASAIQYTLGTFPILAGVQLPSNPTPEAIAALPSSPEWENAELFKWTVDLIVAVAKGCGQLRSGGFVSGMVRALATGLSSGVSDERYVAVVEVAVRGRIKQVLAVG